MPRQTIAITGGTLNEVKALPEWVAKHAWADEILVFDSGSTDGTVELARSLGCRVFHKDPDGNHNDRLRFILEQVKSDWVFMSDPDEFITEELKIEVLEVLMKGTHHSAFTHPRINFFMSHPLHSPAFSGKSMKLARREAMRVVGTGYHDEISINGSIGALKGAVHHFPNPNIHWFMEKHNYISEFDKHADYKKYGDLTHRRFAWLVLTRPPKTFFKHYFKKRGYKDGIYGFIYCLLVWMDDVVRLCKYWETYIEKNPKVLKREDLPDPWRNRK